MRVSLFTSADPPPIHMRSSALTALENQAVATELAGFSALWLAEQRQPVPARAATIFSHMARLSAVTDRIDLGVVLSLPPRGLWPHLLDELRRLDDLASGRIRVALDLQPAGDTADSDAISDLLIDISEQLDALRSTSQARRLSLLANPLSATVAGTHGLGLLLPPGLDVHARCLALAHYHEGRATRMSWVTRLLSVAVATDSEEVVTLRGQLPLEIPLIHPTPERTMLGTASEITAQLTVAQIADGLDEVICALAPGARRANLPRQTLNLLGQVVLPHLQSRHRAA